MRAQCPTRVARGHACTARNAACERWFGVKTTSWGRAVYAAFLRCQAQSERFRSPISARRASRSARFLIADELRLDLLDRRETALQIFGQSLREARLPFGNAHRFLDTSQGVLHFQISPGSTQQQSDRRIVFWGTQQIVYCGKIEVQLAGMLGLEGPLLQLDDHEAVKLRVIEQQIEVLVLILHAKMHLAANEGESLAHLQKQLAHVLDQLTLDIPFCERFGQFQESKLTGVTSRFLSKRRLGIWKRLLEEGCQWGGSNLATACGQIAPGSRGG